jgi:hypothetical protein
MMGFRFRLQLAEALGPVNQWYCSEYYRREISDPESLLIYYVRSSGAANFGERWSQAMGLENRWYCSEFYGRDISDQQILWEYYMHHAAARAA